MKKIAALLLGLLFVFSFSMASAEYDKELQFRGLPWGASLDVVSKLYTTFDEKITASASPLNVLAIRKAEPEYTFNNLGQMIRLNYYNSDYVMNVGPLQTNSIDMYFAYLPKDGKLTYDSAETSLYAAQYYFSKYVQDYGINNVGDMWDKLLEKLVLLYGEPDSTSEIPYKNSKDEARTATACSWNGANDTAIVLYTESDRNDSGPVYLTYYTKKGDQLLKDADNAADPNSETYKRLFMNCSGL